MAMAEETVAEEVVEEGAGAGAGAGAAEKAGEGGTAPPPEAGAEAAGAAEKARSEGNAASARLKAERDQYRSMVTRLTSQHEKAMERLEELERRQEAASQGSPEDRARREREQYDHDPIGFHRNEMRGELVALQRRLYNDLSDEILEESAEHGHPEFEGRVGDILSEFYPDLDTQRDFRKLPRVSRRILKIYRERHSEKPAGSVVKPPPPTGRGAKASPAAGTGPLADDEMAEIEGLFKTNPTMAMARMKRLREQGRWRS